MNYFLLIPALVCGLAFDSGLLTAQSNRIAGLIDNGEIVTLPGSVSGSAKLNRDGGSVSPAMVIQSINLLFKPSAQQQNALAQLLLEQRSPLSRDYRRWISPFEFADRFGLSPGDITAVARWLEAQGFSISYRANARNWISFSGSAATVEKTFHTSIHFFEADGHTHYANTGDVYIPAALSDVVAGIRGLDDFHPRPYAHTLGRVRPDMTRGSGHYLAPGDIANIYDINSLYQNGIDGTGEKIAIAGQTDIYLADILNFRSVFGLSPTLPQRILYGADPGFSPDDLVEADLDLEWAGAAAPNATIIYVYSSDVFDSVFYAIDQSPTLAPIISLSYGGCEQDNRGFLDELRSAAQQANSEGITWIASAGDTGAAACDTQSSSEASQGPAVNIPASIPEVTAIGGTEFNENGGNYWNSSNGSNLSSAVGYIPETAWNDTVQTGVLNASGGGISIYYPVPSWQTGTAFPSNSFREVPDVAFSASAYHDPYLFCSGGDCANGNLGLVGGTSVGTPIFAGVLALLNQYLTSNGYLNQAGLGNVNPALYQLAASTPLAFHDITTGSNVVPCASGSPGCSGASYGYYAGQGYDQVTGLGSIDVYNLVTSWASAVVAGDSPVAVTSPAFAITDTGATVGGSVDPDGLNTQFWFEYSTNSSLSNAIVVDRSDAGAGTSSTPLNFNLTGLTASTTYYYQVWAANSAGARQGAILSFTTLPDSGNTLEINASPAQGGIVQPSSGADFEEGSTVPIVATENPGWTFAGWTGNVANPSSPATSVVMSGSQSVTATFVSQQFSDVGPDNLFFDAINLFYTRGITKGCSATMYCPDNPVTRAQMAIFIVRSVYGGDNFTLNQQLPYFIDVPYGSFGYNWIQKMYELGITTGCSTGYYCPDNPVSRGEMAAFIIRMRYAGDPFTVSTTQLFTDVSPTSGFFSYVQRMAQDNITFGCSAGMYCPSDSVTRAEMAVFIMRGAFNWLLPASSPQIVSVTPNQLTCCSSITVTVAGANTHFAQGVTRLVTPQGIAWSSLSVLSPTTFSVVLRGSTTQPAPVYVQTETEEEVLPNGLLPPAVTNPEK